jgi:putative acetyltransferase
MEEMVSEFGQAWRRMGRMGDVSSFALRRLEPAEADAAALVLRMSFDERLPWLAGLHTPDEDRWFVREILFRDCDVWGAFDQKLTGMIAFRMGWVEQLYVLPAHQGKGIGRALLATAKAGNAELRLWTFQRNVGARRFYEAEGFVAIEETDGAGNEASEPDVLYLWQAAATA